MKKKRILFTFCHLVSSNGVSRAAVGIANLIVRNRSDVEVTLMPLYKIDDDLVKNIDPNVKIKRRLGFYFRGLDKLLDLIPDRILYKLFVREKYDIEVGYQYWLPTKIIASSSNKKSLKIAWMHGYDYGVTLLKYYQSLDKVICVSKCNAERLIEESNNSVTCDYCYNPIDDNAIRAFSREAVIDEIENTKRPLFVTVGRLSPEKGYVRLLDVIYKLKSEGYEFNFWFIGSGALADDLKEKADALNLTGYVSFLGEKKNPHKYTKMADAFVCSSFSEGYSTACTEAIMLGVPVISTAVSGAKEIIEASEAGIVTSIDDQGLYNGIKTVLDNQNLLKEWKNNLILSKRNFSLETRKQKIFNVFNI